MNTRIRDLLMRYDGALAEFTPNKVEDYADEGGNALSHLRWMINTMLDEGDDWSDRKTNRWLGFIQGTMWATGIVGILKLRDQSRHLYDEPDSYKEPDFLSSKSTHVQALTTLDRNDNLISPTCAVCGKAEDFCSGTVRTDDLQL